MFMRIVSAKGKRKVAKARATVREGKGIVRYNSMLVDNIQPKLLRMKLTEPLVLAGDLARKVDISIRTNGGGINGQIDAARQAIARGLVEFSKDKGLEKKFIAYDRSLIVYDPRRTEPSKESRSAAGPRRKRQSSKR